MNKEELTQLLYDLLSIQDHITHCNEQGLTRAVMTWQAARSREIYKIVKLFEELQANYNRILNASKGWGMPSEMDDPEEVVTLVYGLYRRIERLNERLEKAGLDMPCEFCGEENWHKINCPHGDHWQPVCKPMDMNDIRSTSGEWRNDNPWSDEAKERE